jgi:hypothetical protein
MPPVEIAYHSNYGEVVSVLARWENSEYSLQSNSDRRSGQLCLNNEFQAYGHFSSGGDCGGTPVG